MAKEKNPTPPTTSNDSAETREGASQPSQDAAELHSTPDETEPPIELKTDHVDAPEGNDAQREAYETAIRSGLSDAEARGDYELAAKRTRSVGDRVRFRRLDADVEITGVHDDGTFDCHVLDSDGSLKLAADGLTPLWYERQSPTELD